MLKIESKVKVKDLKNGELYLFDETDNQYSELVQMCKSQNKVLVGNIWMLDYTYSETEESTNENQFILIDLSILDYIKKNNIKIENLDNFNINNSSVHDLYYTLIIGIYNEWGSGNLSGDYDNYFKVIDTCKSFVDVASDELNESIFKPAYEDILKVYNQ